MAVPLDDAASVAGGIASKVKCIKYIQYRQLVCSAMVTAIIRLIDCANIFATLL
jgi:hypothetical protein